MVAPLTELISCAALKCQRNRKTAAHGGMVLIAQRSQIVCHGSNVTYALRPVVAPVQRILPSWYSAHLSFLGLFFVQPQRPRVTVSLSFAVRRFLSDENGRCQMRGNARC
jgi:hypothetical protein